MTISALTGEGLDELREFLATSLAEMNRKDNSD
jgi:hypothetical protein